MPFSSVIWWSKRSREKPVGKESFSSTADVARRMCDTGTYPFFQISNPTSGLVFIRFHLKFRRQGIAGSGRVGDFCSFNTDCLTVLYSLGPWPYYYTQLLILGNVLLHWNVYLSEQFCRNSRILLSECGFEIVQIPATRNFENFPVWLNLETFVNQGNLPWSSNRS